MRYICLYILCLISLFCLSRWLFAQSAAGIVDPSRTIDWSQAGIVGGIQNRTNVCTTLSPGATAAQINSAIAGCPENQVVFLNSGTYNLSTGIDFSGQSNVTLRGAGPNQTILKFTGAVGCEIFGDICVAGSSRGSSDGPGTLYSWTNGYSKGTTQITLGSVSGLSVGSFLVLDQLDDSSDTGSVLVSDSLTFSQEGGAPAVPIAPSSSLSRLPPIPGNLVTIYPGLHMPNWRPS